MYNTDKLVTSRSGFTNLTQESLYLSGARDMLLCLSLYAKISFGASSMGAKDSAVYDKAILDFLLSDKQNVKRYLEGVDDILFYDHVNDKKGKPVSVKAKFK